MNKMGLTNSATEQTGQECPWCDSTHVESDGKQNECNDCGKAFDDIVGNHYELLKGLEEDDDPAFSGLGSSILTYGTANYESG